MSSRVGGVRRKPNLHAPTGESLATSDHAPAPYMPGSFDDVVAAYDQGKIADDEYSVLSEAAAKSKQAEDRRKG
jgi:hypothetical protein